MEKEKIITVVGVLDVPGSTNISMAYSLAKLGYKILPINYRTVIAQNGMKFFEEHLLGTTKEFKPELIVFCKCNGIDPEIVKKCSETTKTWLFNPDPKKTIEQCPEVLEHSKYTTFSSCTGLDVMHWFKEAGAKNCYHIIQGTDPDLFKPMPIEEKYIADISFIGNKTPERDGYLNRLKNEGFNVKAYGLGYDTSVINLEFSKVCSSSMIMLSLNTYNNEHREYFSNRLVRYLSCGTCTLHMDNTGTLDKYFKNFRDILYFSDADDLVKKLRDLDTYNAGRIAFNGRERVLNYFTWDKIMKYMMGIVNG